MTRKVCLMNLSPTNYQMGVAQNLAFGARLDCKNIVGNKTRWTKIAEAFENKTKQCPKDTFVLKTNNTGEIYFYPKYYDKKLMDTTGLNDKGVLDLGNVNYLEQLSEENVADILKRLFVIRKKADKMLVDYYKLENKYSLADIVKDQTDRLYCEFIKARETYVKNIFNKDKDLFTLGSIKVI